MAQLVDFPACDTSIAQLDWRCGPVGQSRDSDALERSNFDHCHAALLSLDPAGHDHELVLFGHWACGWVEEIFTRPGSACEEFALSTKEALEGYGVLDEDLYLLYEQEEQREQDFEPESETGDAGAKV